jgi:hypothetical protein
MSAELDTTLRSLHRHYVELTQHSCPFALCERRWLEFHNAGLALDDLQLTIEHVLRVNKKRERQYWIALRFDRLIGDLEFFAAVLGEARADKRARDFKAKLAYVPDKASVLRATGRPDSIAPAENVRKVSDVFEAIRKAAK